MFKPREGWVSSYGIIESMLILLEATLNGLIIIKSHSLEVELLTINQ